MVAITTISSRTRAMTRYNFRRFSTQMHLYAFFLLHTSVADTFEFKEILCLHSLNCISIQIAFIFKLKASLTCLFNCRTIFPLSFLWSPISLTVNTDILSKYFPHSILRSSKLIGILSSIFLRRHCNILFSETSVAMLDFIVISNVGLFTILPCPVSFSWELKYYVCVCLFPSTVNASPDWTKQRI